MELWIGKDDMLLRRVRLSGPISPDEDDGRRPHGRAVAFDEPVQIAAPETS